MLLEPKALQDNQEQKYGLETFHVPSSSSHHTSDQKQQQTTCVPSLRLHLRKNTMRHPLFKYSQNSKPSKLIRIFLPPATALIKTSKTMGMVFGKITVETPKYKLLHKTPDYEIRLYPGCVIAQTTYDPSKLNNNRDAGFMVLANYIGALGHPQNAKPEKISMTAPVITTAAAATSTPEKIAMTAPVMTSMSGNGISEVTMGFILPAKYTKAEEAPRPLDERVEIKEIGERKYGVVTFNGVAGEEEVRERVQRLRMSLERDGYKIVGEYQLARYNPPWTLPFLRTNEVMIPVE